MPLLLRISGDQIPPELIAETLTGPEEIRGPSSYQQSRQVFKSRIILVIFDDGELAAELFTM